MKGGWKKKVDGRRKGMGKERGWKKKGDGRRKGMEEERGWEKKGDGRRKGMEEERGGELSTSASTNILSKPVFIKYLILQLTI